MKMLAGNDLPEKPGVEKDVKPLGAAEIQMAGLLGNLPVFHESAGDDTAGGEGLAEIGRVDVDGQERRPYFAVIAGNGWMAFSRMRGHVGEDLIIVKEIGEEALVSTVAADQSRNLGQRNDIVPETLLILGGEVCEAVFSQKLLKE